MIDLLVGLFLIAHGLIHLMFFSPAPPEPDKRATWPFDRSASWLMTRIGLPDPTIRAVGAVLSVITAVVFATAGLGAAGLFGGWETLAQIAAISGLILLSLYWHLWLSLGIAINLVILILVL
jgi:hypothetical protein